MKTTKKRHDAARNEDDGSLHTRQHMRRFHAQWGTSCRRGTCRLWLTGLVLVCSQAIAQPALLRVGEPAQRLGISAERLSPSASQTYDRQSWSALLSQLQAPPDRATGQEAASSQFYSTVRLPSLKRGKASAVREWMLVYEGETRPGQRRDCERTSHERMSCRSCGIRIRTQNRQTRLRNRRP